MPCRIALLMFPGVQALDLVGPHDVFAALPDTTLHRVAKSTAPLPAAHGLVMTPDTDFDACPDVDVLCVPGGSGVDELLLDDATLAFVRRAAASARYLGSVCTGALVLGAAGLLRGRRATTHWASLPLLAPFGAMPVQERVVRDGRLVTGGGVTAGIDFALTIARELHGEAVAQAAQLAIEYAPAPPFDAGCPATAPCAVVDAERARYAPIIAAREARVAQAAARLAADHPAR
ncbi:DJ-1/PfpI family protein [Burkholderia glumae]|uniref:DJ-1/PfpI family protein n=1 Tax=Burkholderia glumae TaxID=337 RepID=UPI001296B7C5|nr:DJ-1/PfpI family protein [Burkholderia glumae]MCM2550419.1 DJ-1/PfpI family protein [Burkholderia glumae]MCR1768790.1 DJ-1/PfpI family protein [Burkholderia glumae]NVE22029.1 DJ-1/PfpI family protein [Burkholderia glumae]QGA38243.1 DJ-1/PfpI family protein [Burkholderia glumae]QHP92347.1 DJ-1/PfpI family protein [Burkholderia glumae]